jgi:hypothetical protein
MSISSSFGPILKRFLFIFSSVLDEQAAHLDPRQPRHRAPRPPPHGRHPHPPPPLKARLKVCQGQEREQLCRQRAGRDEELQQGALVRGQEGKARPLHVGGERGQGAERKGEKLGRPACWICLLIACRNCKMQNYLYSRDTLLCILQVESFTAVCLNLRLNFKPSLSVSCREHPHDGRAEDDRELLEGVASLPQL